MTDALNPSVWVQEILSEKYPGKVFKDVSEQAYASGRLPSTFIQHHLLLGRLDEDAAEWAVNTFTCNIRLRVVAPTSAEAYKVSWDCLRALQRASRSSRMVAGILPDRFSIGQVPVENYKINAVKATAGSQMDSLFGISFLTVL